MLASTEDQLNKSAALSRGRPEESVFALVSMAKALVEFAILLLLGRGVVYLISFGRHEVNPVYRFMRFLTSPVVRIGRAVAPRFVVDQHVPALALILLVWLWVGLKLAQIHVLSLHLTQAG
jgi:hypothetical protein